MGNIFSCSLSLDNVFSRCLDCTAKHTNYAWKLREDVKILQNDWEELKRKRSDIKERIEVEERDPHMKRLEEVAGWLSDVDAMEAAGVDRLIEDGNNRASENKCLGGCCPKSCITSYKLGKKVAKKQREVTSLKSKGIFEAVTHRAPLPPIDERPAELTLGLESTVQEVWSSLKDEQVRTIGIYGMGGVGKTTLLTQVHNELCNNSIDASLSFNVIIWTVVSQIPNLTKVQDDIGEKIGLRIDSEEWKIKSQEKKADDIFRVLKEKKFVLFLDDIWKRLDLKELGVPSSFSNQNNKSKVVFTTRFKDVCGDMEAHKHIQVKCLEWKEAWDLFQQKVGKEALEAHPEIPDLAKDVAKECDGLPLALITIGRAMACKMTREEWNHDKDLLKRYNSEFSGMEKIFNRLKFSYDSLSNAIVRSCFLYCSLYSEDWEISKQELIDKWICEGFLVKFEDDLHKARNEGHHYISTLVRASLLEECSPEKVKMHDVIRDMALWIAAKNKFFVQAGAGLSETPNVADWEGAERVSLMNNEITDFTETPDCPNLLTLFLNNNNNNNNNNNKCKFSSGFFRSMPNLRVLDVESCNLDRFPEEICELVSLQYLSLSNNEELRKLPIRLQNLINLKCLNLSHTKIDKIPEGLLSSFKKLQILKLIQYIDSVGYLPKTFVEELESLKYLNDLEINVTTHFELSGFSSSHKLTSITTTLDIDKIESMRYLDLSFLKRMTNLKSLQIDRCIELEEMIYNVGEGKTRSSEIRNDVLNCCFHSLRSLRIKSCNKIKNVTWLTFAPNVEAINIFNCSEMKALVSDEEEGGRPIFAKLTTVCLNYLPQLESIYPSALPFPCLKKLTVIGCPKLKKLPFNSSSSCQSGITIEEYPDGWNEELEWEDETTRLAFQSSFKPLFK